MGQKVNPIGLRLGIIRSWDSNWYDEKSFASKLAEDTTIRNYVRNRLKKAGISRILIERTPKRAVITITTSRPGIVIYTATRWGNLVNPKRTPPGLPVPRGSDCYRFVLTNPNVDVCMTGPADLEQMKEALAALDRGPLSPDELEWMIKVGDHVHRKNPWINI